MAQVNDPSWESMQFLLIDLSYRLNIFLYNDCQLEYSIYYSLETGHYTNCIFSLLLYDILQNILLRLLGNFYIASDNLLQEIPLQIF